MSNYPIGDWSDHQNILQLLVNDFSALEKKVKIFLKKVLKVNYADQNELQIVISNLKNFQDCIENIGSKPECSDFIIFILDLVVGHSRIREIFLENPNPRELRIVLIELFCLLCSCQIELAKDRENLIDFVLGTYNATLSYHDQLLLQLLFKFESAGLNLQRYQPFMWGVNGASFYAAKQSQKLAFLKLPTIEQTFKGINTQRMAASLSWFPIHLKMFTDSQIEIYLSIEDDYSNCYDPRFILPMYHHFLSNQTIVKCHKFISFGGLSYAIASLSSECEHLREIAYKILSQLHHHLECASYPQDRQLWIGLIDYIRSGLTEPNQRIDCIHTVFLVNFIEILSNPLGPMFPSAREYLIRSQFKPYNFKMLPAYYRIAMHLVSTSSVKSYTEFQKFIIIWINDSLRTGNDIRQCHRKGVFNDMLILYNSPLCAVENRPLIMNLILTAAKLYDGIKVLCLECAIFTWIKHQLITFTSIDGTGGTNKGLLFKLVVTIWQTAKTKTDNIDSVKRNIFYQSFGYELIDVLTRIMYKCQDRERIDKFTQIMEHILSQTNDELYVKNIKFNACFNLPFNLRTILSS